MDPNANLSEMRRIAARILAALDAADEDTGEWMCDPHDTACLAELVEALDGWLSRGGFLPARWERK